MICSGNGLSSVRRQAITWTNAVWLSIGLMGTNFSQIGIEILSFSFKNMYLKTSSVNMAAILFRERWVNSENDIHWFVRIVFSTQLYGFGIWQTFYHGSTIYIAYNSLKLILPNVFLSTIRFVTAVDVWELISNFIPHFIGFLITYPCCDWN